MDIRGLDPHDETAARAWYAALYAGATAGRVMPAVIGEDKQLALLRTNDSNTVMDRRAFGAWRGDTCLGTATLAMPRVDNLHSANIDINVRPEHRRQGVGAALFDHAHAVARAAGRTTLHGEVGVPPQEALADSVTGRFVLARGFHSVLVMFRLVLDLPVPEARLTELEALAGPAATGYRVVSWLGVTPARWLPAIAEMHTLMGYDEPMGEVDWEPVVHDPERIVATQTRMAGQGFGLLTTLVLDADEAPVGYTYLLVSGTDALQDDTFVLRAHRGHRLGILAKAANLRLLAKHFPEATNVQTQTADVNGSMRAINDRFGFRHVETMHEVDLVEGS